MNIDKNRSDTDQGIEQRAISRVIVISPKGLGDKRYHRISKHLATYTPKLPQISRIDFANKNYFDYSNSACKNWVDERHSLFTRLKWRLNLDSNKQDFGTLYDKYFRSGDNTPDRLVYSGEHACAIAHIAAWQSIQPTDDLCLILEDDAALLPGFDSTAFAWPAGAHVLQLITSAIHLPLSFNGDFELLPRKPSGSCYVSSSAAYLISYEGAQILLNNLLPIHVAGSIDCQIFCRQCAGLRAYVTRRPFAHLLRVRALIYPRSGRWFLIHLQEKLRSAKSNSKFALCGSFLWRITPQFIKRFIHRRVL